MRLEYLRHLLAPANVASESRRIAKKYWRKARRVDQRLVTLEPKAVTPESRGARCSSRCW